MHTQPELRESTEPRGPQFWGGFAAGALIGTAAAVVTALMGNAVSRRRDRRVVRFEDSVQIGRPLAEVFHAWSDFESLPRRIDLVKEVRVRGSRSEWHVVVDGKEFRWDAEVTQYIPQEAIGWKSVSGPKHTGRINFSRIGEDTLVHVTMNYAPPLGPFGGILSVAGEHIESQINDALRQFKASLEGQRVSDSGFGPRRASWRQEREVRATGTLGADPGVDWTRPPAAPYPVGRTEPATGRSTTKRENG